MDNTKIRFGDKLFLYGQLLSYLYDYDEYNYNSVMGYMTYGGYNVIPIETDVDGASIPGFIVDFLYEPSLATATPFSSMEMIDVTDKLALSLPLPSGTTVWMPIPNL